MFHIIVNILAVVGGLFLFSLLYLYLYSFFEEREEEVSRLNRLFARVTDLEFALKDRSQPRKRKK